MARILAIPGVLILLLLAALWWSGGASQPRAQFTFINRGDIYTLDVNQMSYLQDFRLTYAMREGLYDLTPRTYRPVPAGAQSGKPDDANPRIWTFKLRKACKWDDGSPVVAGDYVFSWRRILEEPGEYTYLFYYIKGAKRYSMQLQDYFTFDDRLEDYREDAMKYVRGREEYDIATAQWEIENPRPSGDQPEDAKQLDEWKKRREALDEKLKIDLRPVAVEKPKFEDVGIRAPDDYTLVVELNDPVSYLPDLLAFPPFFPRHAKSMEPFKEWQNKEKGQYTYRTEYTRPPYVVTNGPFKLVNWEFKRRLVLEKSPFYWDKGNVKSETLEMVVTDNPLNQFLMYERGQVEWHSDVRGDLAAELRAKGRTDLRTSPAFGTEFLTFLVTPELAPSVAKDLGMTRNPLADVRVRQAMTMAVDRKFIADNCGRLGQIPARTYVPPDGTLPGYTWLPGPFDRRMERYTAAEMSQLFSQPEGMQGPGPGLPFNIQKAKELLKEAGYPEGKGFPPLPIIYGTNNPVRQKLCQVLKNQWKRNLGIEVQIQGVEGQVFSTTVQNKDYAIATVGWYGDYPDVSTFTDKYLSTSRQNDSAWKSQAFDKFCADAAKESDVEKRLRILEKAANMIDTEVPILPLYYEVNSSLSRDSVTGCEANPRHITLWKNVGVER